MWKYGKTPARTDDLRSSPPRFRGGNAFYAFCAGGRFAYAERGSEINKTGKRAFNGSLSELYKPKRHKKLTSELVYANISLVKLTAMKQKERIMKRILSLIMALMLSVILLAGCSPAADDSDTEDSSQSGSESESQSSESEMAHYPITFTDQAGNEVTIEEEPTKIAVAGLPPFSSFLIQFTGTTDNIVAMPGNSLNYPIWIDRVFPGFADIPTVGMGPNFEVEEILATEHDLIIVSSGHEENYNILRESGIPTVGLTSTADGTDTLKTANSWYEILGTIFDEEEKADALIENSSRIRDLVESTTATIADADMLSGLMLPDYSENIIEVSNNDYYGGFWLGTSGISNVAVDVVGWESNMEEVIGFDPNVIYLSSFSAYTPSQMMSDGAVAGHTWSVIDAAENDRIFKFPVGLFNWYALSPDASLSLLWVATSAYPDAYADVDISEEVKTHYSLFGIDLTDEEVADLLAQD